MSGLPFTPENRRPRDLVALMFLSPLERLTEALERGEAFDEQNLADMQAMQRRLTAFDRALTARVTAAKGRTE